MRQKESTSILIVGLDGVSPDMLRKMMDSGNLPYLASIYTRGVFGKLRTTIPSNSAPAWASFYTGMNPGKHGVYEFVDTQRRLISSATIKGRKLWQILSDAGFRCCIINAPLTYPPEKINGYMISSWLSPTHRNRRYTYPPSLVDKLEDKGYKLYPDIIEKLEKSSYGRPLPEQMFQNREALLLEYYDILEKKEEVTVDLLSEETWDLFFWVIGETDAVQHLFYDKKTVLKEFFRRVDRAVGSLLKVFCEENKNGYIFVVSDHGFGSAPLSVLIFRRSFLNMDNKGGYLVSGTLPTVLNLLWTSYIRQSPGS
jgi:predicted AlkP superfamily phosphohydrolase/phosphomutase